MVAIYEEKTYVYVLVKALPARVCYTICKVKHRAYGVTPIKDEVKLSTLFMYVYCTLHEWIDHKVARVLCGE